MQPCTTSLNNLVQPCATSGTAWLPNTPGAREAEGDIQQLMTLTPENNTNGLGEEMHNSNEVTCPQRHASPTSKYQLSERHEKQYHAHGLRR